jgi:hypothetical protein
MSEAIGSVGELINADLAITARKAVDELFVTAPISKNELTDLIFMGDFAFYPKMQDSVEDYLTQTQIQSADGNSTSASERQLTVANSPRLSTAPTWGAALTASRMMAVDWVPCCCSTRRPPIGVSVGGGEVVEVIPGCSDVPVLLSKVIEKRCDDSGQTRIQVVMRDVPSVDYHAQFEMGEEYANVANETITEILLAEFDLPTAACEPDTPVLIEIEMFLSRQMELLIRATDQKTNEAQLLTIPYLNSECGAEDRDAPRKYSVELSTRSRGNLEVQYERDLRGFVGVGHGQKKVLAVCYSSLFLLN